MREKYINTNFLLFTSQYKFVVVVVFDGVVDIVFVAAVGVVVFVVVDDVVVVV